MHEPNETIRLYRHALSGHAHRAELFLSLLGLKAELIDVDLVRGAHKEPDFLRKNPMGQVPVLEHGELTLADSNAILVYLALRFDPAGRWLPRDPLRAAQVQRWLSLAAGELAAGPGTARLIRVFGRKLDAERPRKLSAQVFSVLEGQLSAQAFAVGEAATIADVALYTYTAHAPEGDISLAPYPGIRAWLARIEALPGFVPMRKTNPVS